MEPRYLAVSGGRLAFDVFGDAGTGPLVICAPSIGDLRAEYRFLAPQLATEGYRVVALDIRGQGESNVRWNDYSVAGVGADLLAFVRAHGGGPAYLAGTSMAGGAAIWAAAEAPELIAGLVLIDPVVRDGDGPPWRRWLARRLYGALFAQPWGSAVWLRYFASLYPTVRPDDFQIYTRRLGASLQQPGRLRALRRLIGASKAAAEARLGQVTAPVLIVMGTKDRDFKDPAGEAQLVAGRLRSTHAVVQLIEGAGHYPHAELPTQTGYAIIGFLNSLRARREAMTHGA
jgi:pimeloyl-ACP methyl ester carboxylesterase